MLRCHDIVRRADDYLAGELSWRRRLALHMHLLMCVHCKRFVRQLRFLLRAIPFMHPPAGDAEVDQVMTRLRHGNGGEAD